MAGTDPVIRLSGMRVIARSNGTVFLRLPTQLQTLVAGCSCPYCTTHPNEVSAWDTLAVPTDETIGSRATAWTVHMPDPEEFMRQVAKQKREIPAKLVRP